MSATAEHDSALRTDLGLLILRGAGLFLAVTFGRQKVLLYLDVLRSGAPLASSGLAPLIHAMGFPAPGVLGLCATLSESVGALLVACGLFTRLAAGVGTIAMAVALDVSLRLGEEPLRALLYLVIFGSLAVAGPGQFSLDRLLRSHQQAPGSPEVRRDAVQGSPS
jgi:uncharacterized membrane protein YphA (DoxX/SURF4 family)